MLKPRVSRSAPLREKLFSRFLFTRLSRGFIVTVYLPRTQRYKYFVSGLRRPPRIPISEQTEIANDLFRERKIPFSGNGTSRCHQLRV